MSRNSLNNINYFELPDDETNQLKEFYTSLFGWKFEKGKENEDYWYTKNTGIKGAILKRRDNIQNATFYIEVCSIGECISKAKNGGAKILVEKQEISEGYYALLEDPQGCMVGIWEDKS